MSEQLRRGQAPFLLPKRVLVAGTESSAALAALAKRTLYWPAGWPEELNDRTKTQGRLVVTFDGDFPGGGYACLHIRALMGKSGPPQCAIHGPLWPQGHSPDLPGWQPYVLPLSVPVNPDMTVELDINAPLSRLLLGRY